MKILTGNSNKHLSEKISKYLKNKLVNSSIRKFSDGEIYIEIIKKDTFNIKNNFFSARRSLKNENNDYGRNISIIMIK